MFRIGEDILVALDFLDCGKGNLARQIATETARDLSHDSTNRLTRLTASETTYRLTRLIHELDWEKAEADASLDGYYCIVTSEVALDEREVIDAHRQLWRIEDTFRVTKSTLEVRPMLVWTDSRIRAHFMTCYAALVMLRLLQDLTGWKYSADAIQEGLSSLMGYREDANWYLFANRSEAVDEIGKLLGVDLNLRRYTRSQIKQMLAESRKPGCEIWLKS